MRGRKPTATVIKLARGNPGKRPINKREPRPGPLDPAVPPELTDAIAIEEWRRTIAPAILTGQITAADRTLAMAHAELYAVWRSQLLEAGRHAHIVAIGPHGYPTPNPARLMANKTLMMLAKIDSELGLTPTARSRVQTAEREAPEATSRFFA